MLWYRRTARDLPWRRTSDAYHVWVSEIMLQQTQVATVAPYYARFLAVFPSVEHLAGASLEHVLKTWEGLGYYSRARNLHAAARLVVEQRAGVLPDAAAEWMTLPGVGRYTAAAIASITRGEPLAALDGNMRRVAARLTGFEQPIDAAAAQAELWRLAEALLDREAPGDFNQAMMDLGARICTPRSPACADCPLAPMCVAFQSGRQDELPRRAAKRIVPQVAALAAAVERGGRYLLLQRPPRGLLGGLWGLPMVDGEGTEGETRLSEHIRRATGMRVRLDGEYGEVTHVFTHRRVTLAVRRGRAIAGGRACSEGLSGSESACVEAAWLRPKELAARPLSALDRKALALAGVLRAEA